MERRSRGWFWVFTGPILIAFITVVIVPTIMGIGYSFTSWNGISSEMDFVGLENYRKLASDEGFKNSFWFTAKFAFVSVFTINIVGFGLALLVTTKIKIANLLRGVFFVPNLIGGLILGFIWQFIFINAFDSLGKMFDIAWLQGWLATPETGFWGLVILMTWQMAGYMMIIYIAGIQSVPDSVLEAAAIDGASKKQVLRHVTLPLVMPSFTIGLFLTLSNSFKLYDQNLALTAGGPFQSTQMLAMNIYDTAFKFDDFGGAQAKAVVFMVLVAAVAITQIYISKKKEVEM